MLSCDTAVALGTATADGSVIFAKNSDRSVNECQVLSHYPRTRHAAGSALRCQYIEIPQVEQTWEVIGSRPYWLWGFEMGVNEWGVAIGNEAVYSREPDEEPALLGMDLVRLGLERARTADEALAVITDLLERYGQGGSCEATYFRTYHNSYIIADPKGAWVLETAGWRWVAQRVRDRASISNVLSLRGEWDAASEDLVEHAIAQGWATAGEPFDFVAAYQDPTVDLPPRECRFVRGREVLQGYDEPITVEAMKRWLRDHGDGDLPTGEQELPTICMHLSATRAGETAAAMVAHLRPDRPRELAVTCWTAFGSPCLSVFRPTYPFAVGLPEELDRGDARYSPDSPWWIFERLQRMVAQAPTTASTVRDAFAELEQTFCQEAAATEAAAQQLLERGERDAALRLLRDLVDSTTTRSIALAQQLTEEMAPAAAAAALPAIVEAWSGPNEKAALPPLP